MDVIAPALVDNFADLRSSSGENDQRSKTRASQADAAAL